MPDKLPLTPAQKYRTVKEKVKLYPNGSVDKYKVDSLIKAGHGKTIGKPLQMKGMADMYGPDQGDVIKRLMMPKK